MSRSDFFLDRLRAIAVAGASEIRRGVLGLETQRTNLHTQKKQAFARNQQGRQEHAEQQEDRFRRPVRQGRETRDGF